MSLCGAFVILLRLSVGSIKLYLSNWAPDLSIVKFLGPGSQIQQDPAYFHHWGQAMPTHDLDPLDQFVNLPQMSKISHENVNNFIGVCIDPGHISIVMQYQKRRSLEDILMDSATQSHAVHFRGAICFDIARVSREKSVHLLLTTAAVYYPYFLLHSDFKRWSNF